MISQNISWLENNQKLLKLRIPFQFYLQERNVKTKKIIARKGQ
jgi:hypothetical protein